MGAPSKLLEIGRSRIAKLGTFETASPESECQREDGLLPRFREQAAVGRHSKSSSI